MDNGSSHAKLHYKDMEINNNNTLDKSCCFQHESCEEPRASSHSYCNKHRIDYERMRIYNLSWTEYNKIKDQKTCDSCGREHKKMCIDHCHRTGKVRGILCSPCNLVAGQIESEQGKLIMQYLTITNERSYSREGHKKDEGAEQSRSSQIRIDDGKRGSDW